MLNDQAKSPGTTLTGNVSADPGVDLYEAKCKRRGTI